jgi:hypothetical protein
VAKAMKTRDVDTALRAQGCRIRSETGIHTKWACPCGHHSANIPRHNTTSAAVIRNTIQRITCLPKGWLQ